MDESPQYEYMDYAEYSGSCVGMLNFWGERGWQVVAAVEDSCARGFMRFILMRKKPKEETE